MKRRRPPAICLVVPLLASFLFLGATLPAVHVAPMDSVGPRQVEQQTRAAIVRDYLHAWQCMNSALEHNQADSLDPCFVGQAKDTLTQTIRQQQSLGIQTSYRDRSHDLRVVFYSPEGLSIQLLDDAEYEVDVQQHGKSLGLQRVKAQYVVVLTPTESQWKVRIFQGESE